MKFPRPVLFAAVLVLPPAAALRAQQPSAPPVDPQAVLATLKELRTKQSGLITKEKTQVLAAINAAAADPVKAYEAAVVAVEFQGRGSNEGAQLMEWRKRNAELLRDRNFALALRLQLAYIGLTWQHSMGVKTKDQLAGLYDYVGQVVVNYDALWNYESSKKGLNENVFVRYFQIGPYIGGMADWETQPLNVDGIFQKTILPELRRAKDPRLLAYWDERLQSEAAKADKSANGLTANHFNNVRKPALLWSRAEDELVLGDQNRAVADMLAIIKAFPDHPDFDKWAARLTEIVTPKGESGAPAPAAPSP